MGVVARDYWWGPRADARAALNALDDGNLVELSEHLIANRGRADFSYHFASSATPRELGDGLARIAKQGRGGAGKNGMEPHAYEVTLTDLAGTLALATHGTGDQALSKSWSHDFAAATTRPTELYGAHDGFFDWDGKKRERQDKANKANLLLLLSRGYWSDEFLEVISKEYYEFDRKEGDDAWPEADRDDGSGYAQAPNGAYLTDGVLALTAALTANSTASEWAFTELQPGTVEVGASGHEIGKFTHFLMFEHRFPEASGAQGVGATAALTALSSAIESAGSRAERGEADPQDEDSNVPGPMHDSEVLQTLANDVAEGSGCSRSPLDYGRCVLAAAKAVWRWAQQWGHVALDILTLAAFAPPPFMAVGIAAGATNATWYAIDDDFGLAGLSLAAVAPGLVFTKVVKGAKVSNGAKSNAVGAAGGAARADEVAKIARFWRPAKPWKDCELIQQGGLRLRYGKDWTRAQRKAADAKVRAYYEAAKQGTLVKTKPQRSTKVTNQYRKSAGRKIRADQQIDHVKDLQLGGTDEVSNLKPLDKVVNASLGRQVAWQIRGLPDGAVIPSAAIC